MIVIPTDPTVLAYAAGLIDGEGTLCVTHRGGGHLYCKLNIVNCDKRIIDWLQGHFGQCIYTVRRGGRQQHRVLHVFEVRAFDVVPFLRAVLPYLVIKRDQAELVIKYRETYTGGLNAGVPDGVMTSRRAIRDQLQVLNKRGQK